MISVGTSEHISTAFLPCLFHWCVTVSKLLREMHLTACDADMHIKDYIFIHIEQYLWWCFCMKKMLLTPAYYLITLYCSLKLWNETRCMLPCLTSCISLFQFYYQCSRLSCGFRVCWAFAQAVCLYSHCSLPVFIPGRLKSQSKCGVLVKAFLYWML